MKQYNIIMVPSSGVVTRAGCHDARARGRQRHRRTAKDAESSALGHVEYQPDFQGCSLSFR